MNNKALYLFAFLVLLSHSSFSQFNIEVADQSKQIKQQDGPYQFTTFQLKNGLTIILNEDHSQNDILGAVVVRGGSKLDPKGTSGIAHYFEHLMFKGTQQLGTVDYKAEKPYLDSISSLYELMRLDRENEVFRASILKKIDSFSLIASRYAIPNEVSNVLSSIGGTRINAYTSYENIVYHNHFPVQSLSQWVEIYRDRFEKPVFRLFQSELETVYEEKNMYLDNYFSQVFEELNKQFYPETVYGTQTILGSVEDLRNPSIRAIETYFKSYYGASNMAVVLIGDFNTSEVIPILEAGFGSWRQGNLVEVPKSLVKPFDGKVSVKKKLAPIPFGIIGFRGVPVGHEDELTLKVITQLLSNSSQTGLIDTLVVQQKLLENMVFMDNYYDVGGTFLLYIPKSIVQSMYKAEKYVLMAVDRLKAGDFDDNLLQAVIMNMSKEDIQNMENSNFRLSRIIDSYMSETTIDQIKIENEAVQSISKQDIIRVANKYFGNDYLSFHSKIGFPKKTKLDKPKITPIDPKNKNEKSVMAQRIEKMNSEPIVPKYIDYTSDVIFSDIRQNLHYYQTRNPLNDIFSLNIRFAKGILEEPQLEQLAYYLGHIGTSEQSYTDFARSLQLLGSSISFEVDNDYFTIHIDGFERNLSPTLRSLSQLLKAPKNEASVIKKMVKDEKLNLRLMKKDLKTKMEILQSYALYGSQSEYLNRLTAKEIKKLKHEDFLGLLTRLWSTETFVHFVGNKQESEIKAMIIDYLPFNELIQKSTSPIVRDLPKLNYHKVNFLEDKKAVQTHLRINTISSKLTEADRYLAPVFNYYFGLGMNSLMFREAREYRSLAYGAWGYYKVPYLFHKAGYLMAGMSTQADKTNEALQLLVTLVDTMPFYEEQMSSLKNFMLKSFNTQLPTFRSISYQVQKWNMQGYKTDPSTIAYPIYQNMNMEDIKSFYFSNVSNRYHIINLIGDSKRFDLEKVKQYGEFKTLKLKEILKY